MTLLLAVIRWFHEISLMLLFGGAALPALLKVTLPWNGFRKAAAAVALLGAILWFVTVAAEMGGTLDAAVLQAALRQTLFGLVFQARLLCLILLLLALMLAWRESLVVLFSGLSLVLISVTSHAAQASPLGFAFVGIFNDGLHLLTGGFWIGGLCALAVVYAERNEIFPRAVAVFSQNAIIAVSLLILTGMINAALVLLGGKGHDAGLYLGIFALKMAGVLAMLTLAMVNNARLLPRLAQGSGEQLYGNIRKELLIGATVVALAVVLSLTQPTLG